MTNEDDIYPANPLRDLFRRKRQPMDERLPSGESVGDLVQRQVAPVAQQAAQQVRPRTFRDVLQQRLQQPTPQNPIPQAGMMPTTPTVDLGQGSTYTPEGTGTSRDRRTQPRDYVADDQAYLRELQQHKGPFWKRLAAASIRAGQAASHQDVSPVLTSRERDMAEGQGRLAQDLAVGREQVQMQTFKNRQAQQDEREVNNALTQYNRLEHFDPDDPADAGFAQYFRERGLTLPKKDKYHRPIASWVNGKLILTDNKGTRPAEIEGQPVTDVGRTPNEQGLTPSQQATTTNATLNRNAANTRSAAQIAAANKRNAAGIASREKIATLPQRPRPAGQGAARSLPAGIQQNIAKGYGEYDDYRSKLTDIDAKITQANALPATNNAETAAKNEQLTILGNRRGRIVAEAKKRMSELNQLDPENEWGSGDGGYPYRKPKAGAGTSDLNQPIYGTPKEDPKLRKYADTYFNGNYKAAQDAVRKQRGQ